MEEIRLTQYSHGAGCGCKISPSILDKILHHTSSPKEDKKLLVGNQERDDAAVYDLGNGTALISTTDFFMPIVDNPYDFGRIAATNAISDVYAMGGQPILSIAILGWPINQLAPEVAQNVLEGARAVCSLAGISLAGGHSIDSPEPIFGLSVNGLVDIKNLKRNSTATIGNKLYLTKALGVGALSTAQKKGLLKPEDAQIILDSMTTLNHLGAEFGKMEGVKAMTDVTGFGLLGHLVEMCEASGLSAAIEFDKIPVVPSMKSYLHQKCVPGGTERNWKSYGHKISEVSEEQRLILADPQTSGGLLVAVESQFALEFENYLSYKNIHYTSFGHLIAENSEVRVTVI
ncbi:MAG: selenide, water dikinase SelD [Chitinophagales bacterium]|nr:selenide, water dikinase SelD [Chitinophagales bacterium]